MNTDTYIEDMFGIFGNFNFAKYLFGIFYFIGKLYLFLEKKEKINEKNLEDLIKELRGLI